MGEAVNGCDSPHSLKIQPYKANTLMCFYGDSQFDGGRQKVDAQ